MARSNKIRNRGAIPERRHDAFLLALLLALVMTVAPVAFELILHRFANLMQFLASNAALRQEDEEEQDLPFILVDPALFDEPVTDTPPDAESLLAREARQAEDAPLLPVDKPFIEEGLEDLPTMLDGATGPEESSYLDLPESHQNDTPEEPPVKETETPEEIPEPAESGDAEIEPSPQEMVSPSPAPSPEPSPETEPEPPVEAIPETTVDTAATFISPPPTESMPPPDPAPKEPPKVMIEPEPPPEPEEYPQPVPVPETQELAMLPVVPDGLLDPRRQHLEELALRDEQMRREREEYEQRRREETERRQIELERQMAEEEERRQQEEYQRRQGQEQIQRLEPERQHPVQPPPQRRAGRRQPEIRKISPSAESAPSRRGGAPRQRNRESRIDLLDSDPNMKYLAHKYAEYMRNVARLLQESLNREVLLQPMGYTVGQAKIIFTIAADGTIGYYRTQYPADGDLEYVRITSEQTLVNAGPFEPPTPEMLRDPVFQQMSLTVSLY